MKSRRNRAPLIGAGVYFSLVVLSFVIMVTTRDETPMSSIFLVLFTFPWPGFIGGLIDHEQIPDLVRALFLLAGGLVNGGVLYLLIGWLQKTFGNESIKSV